MAEKISELPKSETAQEFAVLRDLQDRMNRDIERVLFGGYRPPQQGTLTVRDLENWRSGRRMSDGCPHGCLVFCPHFMGVA